MTIPDDEMREAYSWALDHAAIATRGRSADLTEAASDAATDGVMWARDNYDPAKGDFGAFAASAVRRCVGRAIMAHVQRDRPTVVSLDDEGCRNELAAARDASTPPLTIADLPDDLAFCVRLYMVDGFNLRDIGLLTGSGPNAVQRKIRQAAALLAPGRMAPVRKAGARRLGRVEFG